MVPLEVWLLIGSAAAFTAVLWLVGGRRAQGARDFAALADAEGWDHRQVLPSGLLGRMADLSGVEPESTGELYLAGPSSVGPFQLVRSGGPGHPASRDAGARAWTFVHLRTARASPGVSVRPAPRFSAHRGVPRRAGDISRRLQIDGEDAETAARLGGSAALAILLRPTVPVRIGWEGHDLVVAFPVGVSSPRGAQTLLRYAETLACIAEGGRVRHARVDRALAPTERAAGTAAT